MNLLVRINLALVVVLALAAVSVGYECRSIIEANSQRDVLAEAGLMMDSALAMRAYTSNEILPLLDQRPKGEFLPQSVPSYAATQNFLKLRERHPLYFYKEATLNPTNPRDRAADWEADIIQRFRNDPATREVAGERDTPMGKSLYLARPIRVDSECMSCHSLPATAPEALIARYGSNNGFGWQANEVVGAQVVSVPISGAAAHAEVAFRGFMTSLIAALTVVLLSVNVVLYFLVVRPLARITQIADRLSLGDSAAEFPERPGLEMSALVRSFNRMRKSLEKALKLLET
jgi:HAMP domain-containing protein